MEPINAILLVITLLCSAVCVWLVVRAARADIRMAKKVAQAVKLLSIWKNDEEGLLTRFAFYNYKDEPDVLYLSNLFVEEASRNHGIGTMILKAAEMVAGTMGATYIRLKVMKTGRVRDWYYRRGFDLVASEDGYSWLEKRIGHISAEAPAELEKEQPFTAESIRKAAKAYSERASNGHHFDELDSLFKAFRAGAVWQGKRVAAYIRECLAPEEEWATKREADDTEANKNYRRGKIRGYKDILGDLESGGLDEYMSEKEKEE